MITPERLDTPEGHGPSSSSLPSAPSGPELDTGQTPSLSGIKDAAEGAHSAMPYFGTSLQHPVDLDELGNITPGMD